MPAETVEQARALLLDASSRGLRGGGGRARGLHGRRGRSAAEDALLGGFVAFVEPGWEERWREFHRPIWIGPLWVGPPWEEPSADAIAVVIDPGRAFGTGSHPTTRLCLDFLLSLEPGSLVDVGCGSGVLSIAAAKLGFGPITAIDHDEAAVEAARRNVEANGVEVDVLLGDALGGRLPSADVGFANIDLSRCRRSVRRSTSARS